MRAEYIAGGTSYRILARKYGVALSALSKHAKDEHWPALRKQAEDIAGARAVQKTAEAIANNAAKIERARGLAIDKILRALERMPENSGSHARQTISEGGKRMTVDHDLLELVTALEKLTKGDGVDTVEPVTIVWGRSDESV